MELWGDAQNKAHFEGWLKVNVKIHTEEPGLILNVVELYSKYTSS